MKSLLKPQLFMSSFFQTMTTIICVCHLLTFTIESACVIHLWSHLSPRHLICVAGVQCQNHVIKITKDWMATMVCIAAGLIVLACACPAICNESWSHGQYQPVTSTSHECLEGPRAKINNNNNNSNNNNNNASVHNITDFLL